MGEPRKPVKSWVHKTAGRTLVIEVWERLTLPQPQPSKGSRAARFALYFLIYWALVTATMVFDPFEVGSVTSRYSHDMLNRVLGIYYPGVLQLTKAEDTADNRPQVAVVLLDETALEILTPEGERKWPARPSLYATVLESTLKYKPEAVMVDLLFVDAFHDKTAAFERALRHYDKEKIHLVFAGASGSENRELVLVEEMPEILTERLTLDPSLPVYKLIWDLAAELEYVHIVSTAVEEDDDGSLRRYPLEGPLHGQARGETAAAKLYEIATERKPDPEDDWMTVFWSLNVNETNSYWMDCNDSPKNFALRVIEAFWSPASLRQGCPATPTVPVLEIALPTNKQDPDAVEMIANNIVLIGLNADGIDDYVTPVNPRLPGVYVHAMALDNLLRLDGGYLRQKTELGGFTVTSTQINRYLGAPVIALAAAIYLSLLTPFVAAGILWRIIVARALLPIVCMIVSLPFAWLFLSLRLVPFDWIGLSLFGLPVLFLTQHQWEKIQAAIRRTLASLSGGPGSTK